MPMPQLQSAGPSSKLSTQQLVSPLNITFTSSAYPETFGYVALQRSPLCRHAEVETGHWDSHLNRSIEVYLFYSQTSETWVRLSVKQIFPCLEPKFFDGPILVPVKEQIRSRLAGHNAIVQA